MCSSSHRTRTLFLGVDTGFKELKEAGMIRRVPRLVGVQSAACAPLYRAFRNGWTEPGPLRKRETVAEGLPSRKPSEGADLRGDPSDGAERFWP